MDENAMKMDASERPAQTAQDALSAADQTNPATACPDEAAPADVDVATIEAILFATDSPLSPAKIAEVAGLGAGRRAVRLAVEQLNQRYERMGCAFRVESLAGGYQLLTLPEYNEVLKRLLKVRGENKLTQAQLEALAIVAYKQPILRADIEGIRGVSSGEMLRGLMEKGLVKIVGRAEEIGRPMLYGTTRRFLEIFGLNDLKDLPQVQELAEAMAIKAAQTDTLEDAEAQPAGSPGSQAPATDPPPEAQAGGTYAAHPPAPAAEDAEADSPPGDAATPTEPSGPDE